MPFRIKFACAALVVSLVVIASWANGPRLFGWYSRFWHVSVRGENAFSELQKLQDELKVFEARKGKIAGREAREDFVRGFERDFTRRLDAAVLIYAPELSAQLGADEKELCRFAGLWFLDSGDTVKGARLILRTVGSMVGRDEIIPFTRALESLYDGRMYSDFCFEAGARRFDPADETYPPRIGVYFRYGVSLYHLKRYRESIVQLQNALNAGYSDDDLFYYMGASLRELKQVRDAIPWAEKALAGSPRDKRYRALLVSLYNADGRRKDAERASRGY